MRANILKDALKSYELAHQLRTWLESDNTKQTLEDFTPAELIEEANAILYFFNSGDSILNDLLESEDLDDRKHARREIKTLKAFIKKHEVTL
jgi:hypothetical protein